MPTIDSCYEGIIANLTEQGKIMDISLKLLSFTTNEDRVLYVHKLIETLKAFPKALEVSKKEHVSVYYRNLGNKCFQKSKDYEAWQYYNLSLLHAPPKSNHFSIALANRSAVFFSLKKYKSCLNDINEVFTGPFPEKLKEKLITRKSSCEKSLAVEQENKDNLDGYGVHDILTLKGPRNARYPCASTKIKVVINEQMGRHVIAHQDIKVGEVIAIEEPYFTLLLKSQFLFECSYCLSRHENLSPCDYCCFSMYCSKDCKDTAWKTYHSTECTLMPALIDLNFTKLELLALRTVIKARSDHADWESLFQTIKGAESHVNTEYHGLVKINDQWVYDSKYYASIHTLASNVNKRSVSDIFQKSVTAAVFLNFVMQKTSFMKAENEDEADRIKKCVADTLLLHVMTSPTNMHNIGSNIQTEDGNFVQEISLASAPYAFLSLFNHSCAPNVVRFSKLGTGIMTLFALRPIKKGMQLFDNYGEHHAISSRDARQRSLNFQYKFTCLCEACLHNWPLYIFLKSPPSLPSSIRMKKRSVLDSGTIEKLQKGDRGTAVELFKPICELAEALEPYAPCIDLADCQEALKQCLVILLDLVPFGYSKLIEWSAKAPV